MKPIKAYSLYKLGKLSSDKIAELANLWLDEGIYTDSLNDIFSTAHPNMADLSPAFEKAMKELGVNEPTRFEAAQILIKATLKEIVENKIEPDEGASFIYWDVHHELTDEIPDKEYVGDNLGLEHIFCWLREIWDCRDGSMILYYTDLPRAEAEIKFKEHLTEEAKKWLETAT